MEFALAKRRATQAKGLKEQKRMLRMEVRHASYSAPWSAPRPASDQYHHSRDQPERAAYYGT